MGVNKVKLSKMKAKTELQKQVEATLWLVLMAIFFILTIIVTI